jgi:hypothetical protein
MRRCIFAIIFVVTLATTESQASLIILGNLPGANDNFGSVVDSGTANGGINPEKIDKAVSFTMPSQSFPIDHVAVRLREYNTAAGDVAAVGFYLDNGADAPGVLVGNLLASPPSNSVGLDQFDFVPTTPLTLSASTKYWLVLSATMGAYQWQGPSPKVTPTSPLGTMFGKQIGVIDGVPRDVTLGISGFELVSSIPEPSASMLFGASVIIGSARSRRRTYWSIT